MYYFSDRLKTATQEATLLESVAAFFEGSIEWREYQRSGVLNVNTLSAICIFVTSLFEIWGLLMQGWTIWRKRSGESVSIATFNFTAWYFTACGMYGVFINSAVSASNGLITGLVHLPILIGLLAFKRFLWWETVLSLLCIAMVPAILFAGAEYRGNLFVVLGLVSILAFVAQPLELLKTGKTGAVDIRLFSIYAGTSCIWVTFAWSIGDLPFITGTTACLFINTLVVCMWCWYRAREPNPPRLLAFLSAS